MSEERVEIDVPEKHAGYEAEYADGYRSGQMGAGVDDCPIAAVMGSGNVGARLRSKRSAWLDGRAAGAAAPKGGGDEPAGA